MASHCTNCGNSLGIGRRLAGKVLCATCQAKVKQQQEDAAQTRDAARKQYTLYARRAADPMILALLPSMAQQADLSPAELARAHLEAWSGQLRSAMADEYLSAEEEAQIDALGSALQVADSDQIATLRSLGNQTVIARMNAGRLEPWPRCSIMLKRGEVPYLEVDAALLKEVVHRETRGSYGGFSIPIGMGIRYRTGAYRGKSVVTGTSMEVADTGTLTVTSQRAVFKGLRQAVESQFTKLLGVNVFDDGIQIHVSNRKTAPLFRVGDGHLVGAAINAAVQQGA